MKPAIIKHHSIRNKIELALMNMGLIYIYKETARQIQKPQRMPHGFSQSITGIILWKMQKEITKARENEHNKEKITT